MGVYLKIEIKKIVLAATIFSFSQQNSVYIIEIKRERYSPKISEIRLLEVKVYLKAEIQKSLWRNETRNVPIN